ncbi:hypothetical protein HCU40_18860 (plasmid) [Pseudanabaena biceps]|jgi:hypothetical protein|nr:hypothetical protein [Pseudanabaena biceps]
MRAVKVNGTVDRQEPLLLDQPIDVDMCGAVRVIVLFLEPIEEVKAILERALQQDLRLMFN